MGEPVAPPQRILLDTDLSMGAAGSEIDDGFALALAVAESALQLELVTTVHGNTDVDTATRLSVDLMELLGRSDIPVVRGAAGPLDPRWRWPDRDVLPSGEAPAGTYAATALIDRVMAEPGELTIVAIGPLTNVALALLLEPRVATSVREIVVMGGVYLEQTNVSVMPGEWNFWCDPSAAEVVLRSGAGVRLVGLDVTTRVRLTRADAERLADRGGRFAALAAEHTQAWIDHQERTKPHDERELGSCALHDPLAVAVVARPGLVTWQRAHVSVETTSPVTRGQAVADLLTRKDPPDANCEVATAVDAEAFSTYFIAALAGLP